MLFRSAMIKTMSLPNNSSPSVQAPLWQQLAQMTSVAQVEMAAPDAAQAKAINTNKAAQAIMKQLGGANATTMDNIGRYLATSRQDAWQLLNKTERAQVIRGVAKALTANGVTVQGFSPTTSPGTAATALSTLAASNPVIDRKSTRLNSSH